MALQGNPSGLPGLEHCRDGSKPQQLRGPEEAGKLRQDQEAAGHDDDHDPRLCQRPGDQFDGSAPGNIEGRRREGHAGESQPRPRERPPSLPRATCTAAVITSSATGGPSSGRSMLAREVCQTSWSASAMMCEGSTFQNGTSSWPLTAANCGSSTSRRPPT